MRELLKTKQQKIDFIIRKLEFLKGLEFIDTDEIQSCNLAIRVLKSYINKSK